MLQKNYTSKIKHTIYNVNCRTPKGYRFLEQIIFTICKTGISDAEK